MSDLESSESDNDNPTTVEMFQCRKCPGQLFTSAEKDLHRKKHKQDKVDKSKENKPGPKSRRSTRATSPAASGVTLFDPVTSPDPQGTTTGSSQRPGPASRTKRGRSNEGGKSPTTPKGNKKKKIRSKKHMDNSVVYNTTNGG